MAAGLLALALGGWAPVGADDTLSVELLREIRTVRSESRRFVAIGRGSERNLDVVKWAEATADSIERVVHVALPRVPWRVMRIRVGDGAEDPLFDEGGDSQGFEGGTFVQHLTIDDYVTADIRDVEARFCRLFLDGYLVDAYFAARHAAGQDATPEPSEAAARLPRTPEWLTVGVAANLSRKSRAATTHAVLAWRHAGQTGRIEDVLAWEGAARPGRAVPGRALCGVVVAWLSSYPTETSVFQKIFNRLAAAEPILPSWLATEGLGLKSVADLNTQWSAWLDQRRYTVFEPGTVSAHDLRQLDAELLLSTHRSGIPLEKSLPEGLAVSDLAAHREAAWLPRVIERKLMALRLLAIGRSPEYGDVIAAYCLFLEALRDGAEDARLAGLLNAAESAHRDLLVGAAPGTDGDDGAAADRNARGASGVSGGKQ